MLCRTRAKHVQVVKEQSQDSGKCYLDKVTWFCSKTSDKWVGVEGQKEKEKKSDRCVTSYVIRKSKLFQEQDCCKLILPWTEIYHITRIRRRSLSECQNATEMLQTEISHMFDNSLYSKCNIHRKLQQALARLLRKLEMQRESLQCFHFKDKEKRSNFLCNILTKKMHLHTRKTFW